MYVCMYIYICKYLSIYIYIYIYIYICIAYSKLSGLKVKKDSKHFEITCENGI